MYRNVPGRPDCNSPSPEFDGECPRRKNRPHPVAARFLFLAGIFMQHKLPPYAGGLYDQDLRFVTALALIGAEVHEDEMAEIKKMLQKMQRMR